MVKHTDLPYCPFFVKETSGRMYCEGGTIKFPDRLVRKEFLCEYCSNENNHTNCMIYQTLMRYYDRKE